MSSFEFDDLLEISKLHLVDIKSIDLLKSVGLTIIVLTGNFLKERKKLIQSRGFNYKCEIKLDSRNNDVLVVKWS